MIYHTNTYQSVCHMALLIVKFKILIQFHFPRQNKVFSTVMVAHLYSRAFELILLLSVPFTVVKRIQLF